MIRINKSIENKIFHYTFWNKTIIQYRENLTVIGMYGPEEGREEADIAFYIAKRVTENN
jgi:hypothetical protein